MKLRQLECFLRVVESDLSMSKAAAALGATQPAVSKQIRLLEAELGVTLFTQRGNRLLQLTEAGGEILRAAQALWREAENIASIAQDYSGRTGQVLSIAASVTHARYMLVKPVREFLARHPGIELRLQQGSHERILLLVQDGGADIGILTTPESLPPELVALPCYDMRHSLVMPVKHPLAQRRSLTLEMLAQYPMIGHDVAHQIGREVRRRFAEAGLRPNFVLQAQDSDVMKAYVEAGLGIAIVPKIAFSPLRDRLLRSRDVSHLFAPTTTLLVLRRGAYPAAHVTDFVQLVAPQLTPKALGTQLQAEG